jgi:RNA-directed DNA polymerase
MQEHQDPNDAPLNGGALPEQPAPDVPVGGLRKVSEMQVKLHRWAVADPGRR